MSTRPLKQPLPGEHIVHIFPYLTLFVDDAGWHRRANMYAGRSLSAEALSGEQDHRAGYLALRGQMVSPGVVEGLEVRVEIEPSGGLSFHISPGTGIVATGEDVSIPRLARIPIDKVPVYRPKDGKGKDTSDFSLTTLSPRDSSKDHVGVLVLVPTVVKPHANDPADPCGVDVDSYAFEDQQLVDGAALVLVAWPSGWPMPPQGKRWRNRLVQWIFEYERWRGPTRRAPWENIGVPLALVGFPGDFVDSDAIVPPFVDRHAVVRTGGAPRSRTSIVRGHGNPLLWQARIEQFSEYLLEMKLKGLTNAQIIDTVRHLPPVGVLPKDAVDFLEWKHRFFPPRFVIDAAPVPAEQLDAVLLASAGLAPLRTDQRERVRVLVPVPSEHFDSRLIQTELLDRAFLDAIDQGLKRLGEWLTRRDIVRSTLCVLLDMLQGVNPQRSFAADAAEVEGETKYFPTTIPAQYAEKPYGVYRTYVEIIGELLEKEFLPWQPAGGEVIEPADGVENEILLAAAIGANGRRYVLECGRDGGVLMKFNGQLWSRDYIHGMMGPLSYWTPTLLAHIDGVVEIISVSPRGTVEIRSRQPYATSWTTASVGDPQGFTFAPAALTLSGSGIAVIVAVDKAGLMWIWQRGASGGWSAGQGIAEGVVSRPVVVEPSSGRVSIFALSLQGQRRVLRHWIAVKMHGQESLVCKEVMRPPQDGDIDAFSVCSWGNAKIHVFARMRDQSDLVDRGKLVYSEFDSEMWTTWRVLLGDEGEQIMGTPAVAAPKPGRLEVFVREISGDKFVLWQASYRSRFGWRWTRLGGSPRSSPTVIFDETGHYQVFVRNEERVVMHRTRLKEEDIIDTTGLEGLVGLIKNKVTSVDNAIEIQFARVQAALFGVRQQMVGTTAASRLITSPALSSIMGAEANVATKSEIVTYSRRLLVPSEKLSELNLDSDIVGRLKVPPAIASWKAAVRLKYEISRRMFELTSSLVFDCTGVTIPAVARDGSGPVNEGEILERVREDILFTDLLALGYQFQGFVWNCLINEPALIDADESQYFSATVRLLEDTVSILRQLEDRIEAHQQQILACQRTLEAVRSFVEQSKGRLDVIQGEIAEARQDVTVARALCAEEESRILGINQKRAAILKEHVRFLVYQRPRERDLTKDTATRVLDPGFYQDILPAVLASTAAAPSEIWQLVQLFQDVPLHWLRRGAELLRKLDRVELLMYALQRAKTRAVEVQQRAPVLLASNAKTSIAKGISRALSSQFGIVAQRRAVTATMELTTIRTQSWSDLQRDALQRITLGDLADITHGRSDVGKEAMEELERIAKVATGLYERFGDVVPTIRLEWAEQFSQYDAAVNLRDLARLPRWNQIEVTDRRELQSLVDWLFGRVLDSEPEAVSLINDLVRVCMLLASHAPVDEIISGHVVKPTVAQIGAIMDLAIDVSRVRIGMHVLVESSGHTVQAVVEDMSVGAARARVFSATAATVMIAEKTIVKLSEPGRGVGAFLPALGLKR